MVLGGDQKWTDWITDPKLLDSFYVRGFDVFLCVFLFSMHVKRSSLTA